MKAKTVDQSRTCHVQVLTQGSINGYNRLFGGKLMEWIDIVAAVVARRHSGKNVTTALVDTLEFKGAAHPNDTVVLDGYITFVGITSMEVCRLEPLFATAVENYHADMNFCFAHRFADGSIYLTHSKGVHTLSESRCYDFSADNGRTWSRTPCVFSGFNAYTTLDGRNKEFQAACRA